MINYKLIGISIVLLVAVSSCRQGPIGNLEFQVANTIDMTISPRACIGGLKVKVVLAGVEVFSETIALGETSYSGLAEGSDGASLLYQGAPISIEAWCLAEDNVATGYAKLQGTLNLYTVSGAIAIAPNYPLADAAERCKATVEEDIPPCISAYNLVE